MTDYLMGNTLVDWPRLEIIKQYLEETNTLDGDIAEVGVYRGGTARWICENTNKHVLLFDTFTGMPPVAAIDIHSEGDFADTSLEHVASVLGPRTNYELHMGVFPRANARYAKFRKFSLVHLDVDIYDSVKECLQFFYPRMVQEGIILLDDYNEPNCPGAKLATDEFCKALGIELVATVQSQAMIRKV